MTAELEQPKRDALEPDRYEYMSLRDSEIYDRNKDSDSPKSKLIVELLLRNRDASRAVHRNSRY